MGKFFHHPKGSAAARAHMARLRAMRGKKKRNPLTASEAGEIELHMDKATTLKDRAKKMGAFTRSAYEAGREQSYQHVLRDFTANPPLLVLGNPKELWTAEAAYARWMEWVDKYRSGADTTAMQQAAAAHGWQFVAHGPIYCHPGKRRRGKGKKNPVFKAPKPNPGFGPRPSGIPPWMWADPNFHAEVQAFRRRHGPRKPIEISKVKVPKGFPKFMSVYGKSDHTVYDAPPGSSKGKRIHHFGKRGKGKPWLVSSHARGPKFLAYVGGNFKAKPSWIYD